MDETFPNEDCKTQTDIRWRASNPQGQELHLE